jgi:hypothetical protein
MFFSPIFRRFSGVRHVHPAREARIAIISTPRSGNTWLRYMLDYAYQCSSHDHGELALFNPLEAPWLDLPDRCIIMTQWHPVEPLTTLLKEHRFFTVTLARHPLDVLISILQYAPCEGSLRWLEGEEGDERPIFGVAPESEEFIRYATSRRAQTLLNVSAQWWSTDGCHRIRYEDLVRNPRRQLARIARSMGVAPKVCFEDTVVACTFERLRNPVTARSIWKGKPGLWRTLLTRQVAHRIASAHSSVFSTLGYVCDPDRTLDSRKASQNWSRLVSAKVSGISVGASKTVA